VTYFKIVSWHFLGDIEENNENFVRIIDLLSEILA
jgi:hypothetical protein